MPETKAARERSVSGDIDDSELEFDADDNPNLPSKPGRKKNPNSQAARRDQNRIAQREFRLRKQQRIRDLEARVEILSGGKDEAIGEMRNILKDLMAENHTLRGLIRSLAGFIGDGVGGILPKIGWEAADFNNFVNKSETDTAWESHQRRKRLGPAGEASSSSSQLSGQKRPSEDDSGSSRKKSRSDESERDQANGYPFLASMNHPMSTAYSPTTRSQDGSAMFSDLIRPTNASPLYMHQSPSTNTSPSYPAVPNSAYNQHSYMSNVSMTVESSLPTMPFSTSASRTAPPQHAAEPNANSDSEELDLDDDPNKNEAYKLIQYHLDNFKRNPNYCLPLSLRPTLVQKTVPHESVMDNILHPELRDRMVLLRARYSLPDCLIDYRKSIILHGDDVLAHHNWEISESFLRKYGFLIDPATLIICNRWRKERGEPELRLSDITGNDAAG
ncbi:transcriptional regulator family: bZIP [Agaricus bisporus var. burnettii]|uniref:Transcriptional regulator family: bZIP n=1 Tax=Agaricus bisporus var. burnettii TaxID=192524 RepID=A0A8H7F3H5_AGABI|nr:transcriptional regulator family: bZIP [Agaricus bisporus var. burnettii]